MEPQVLVPPHIYVITPEARSKRQFGRRGQEVPYKRNKEARVFERRGSGPSFSHRCFFFAAAAGNAEERHGRGGQVGLLAVSRRLLPAAFASVYYPIPYLPARIPNCARCAREAQGKRRTKKRAACTNRWAAATVGGIRSRVDSVGRAPTPFFLYSADGRRPRNASAMRGCTDGPNSSRKRESRAGDFETFCIRLVDVLFLPSRGSEIWR
ncbi:hypothetical protein MTO96_006484 [Rhipicephalus appendiculatus]